MQSLVGIFRTEADLHEAIGRLAGLHARWPAVRVGGGRAYNPGWGLVFELRNMLIVVRGDRPQRPAADGEPRRPQPDRLPGRRPEVGQPRTASSARDGETMDVDRARRCQRCRTISAS